MLAAVKRTRLKRVHLCFIKDWQGAPWARPAHELKQWPAVNLLPSLYPDVQVTIASLHSILKATWSSSTASPSHPAQEEFRFFMEDAGSKLLVLPFKGNAAAEGAAAELGTPTASLSVSSFNGKLSPGRRAGLDGLRFRGSNMAHNHYLCSLTHAAVLSCRWAILHGM